MLNQILTICVNGVHITIYETSFDPAYNVQYGLETTAYKTLGGALKSFNHAVRHALVSDGVLTEDYDGE